MTAQFPPPRLGEQLLALARAEQPTTGAKERAFARVVTEQVDAPLNSKPDGSGANLKLLAKTATSSKWYALALSGALAAGAFTISSRATRHPASAAQDMRPVASAEGNGAMAAGPFVPPPAAASLRESREPELPTLPKPASGPPFPTIAPQKAASGESVSKARSAHSAARETASANHLANEVRLLGAAREALRAHDPARAERALDAYAQLEGPLELQPEASAMRVELLVAKGQRAAALALARRILAKRATGPLAERLKGFFVELQRDSP